VTWASGPALRSHFSRLGIPFATLPTPRPHVPPPRRQPVGTSESADYTIGRSLGMYFEPAILLPAVVALVKVIRETEADLIVTDNAAPHAGLAAELARLPKYRRRVDFIRNHYGLSTIAPSKLRWMFFLSRLVHLVFLPPSWWYDSASDAPPQAQFFGADCPGGMNRSSSRRRIFITSGTVYNISRSKVLARAAEATMSLGYEPIVAAGDRNLTHSLRRTYGCEAYEWLDYSSVLPTCLAAIHHGGMGTIHACMRYGVPQLALPYGPDQPFHTGQIVRHGLGLARMEVDPSAHRIREDLERLLAEVRFAQTSSAHQAALCERGGASLAASTLCRAARGGLDEHEVDEMPALALAPIDHPLPDG
jgi:hypothetical protein